MKRDQPRGHLRAKCGGTLEQGAGSTQEACYSVPILSALFHPRRALPPFHNPHLPVSPQPLQVPGISCPHLELFTVLSCPFLPFFSCRSLGMRMLTCGGMNSWRTQGMSVSLSGVMLRTRSSSCTPVAPQANPRQVCVCTCAHACIVRKGEKWVSEGAFNDINFTLQPWVSEMSHYLF